MEEIRPGPLSEAGIERGFGAGRANKVVLLFLGGADGGEPIRLVLDNAEAEVVGEALTGLALVARDLKVTQTRAVPLTPIEGRIERTD